MYINLASADKKARAAQINTDIGAAGNLLLFTGSPPPSPDYPATGTLLVTLPLSTPAAVASYAVQTASINNPGTGGADGAQLVAGTTGAGTMFQASVTIAGGQIAAVLAIVVTGAYSAPPALLASEPVTGGGLTGASLSLVMTGQLVFNPITQAYAVASGNAGYGRIQTSAAVGVMDLDCGVSGAAITMNTVAISAGGPVLCATDILLEA